MNESSSPSPLRVAVVGLGAIGLEHVDVYRASERAALAAVVDPRDEVRERVARQTGARGFASLAELLAADVVDAISLCTPDDVHFADARAAIDAGLHLLLEKPIATDPAEADALVLAAEAADVVAMPGQTLRFEPRYHHAHRLVADGAIGEVQHGYLRRDNLVSVADRAAGRTSVAFFLGIHDIDALQWVTGRRVVAVQAMATAATEGTGRQAAAVLGTLRLDGGAVVQVESAWNLPEGYPTPLDAQLRLVGSRAVVSVHSFDSAMSVAGDRFELPMTAGVPLYGFSQGALAVEIECFVRCCLDGAPPPVTMREAASAVKVVVALGDALASGGTVAVQPVATAPAGVESEGR